MYSMILLAESGPWSDAQADLGRRRLHMPEDVFAWLCPYINTEI